MCSALREGDRFGSSLKLVPCPHWRWARWVVHTGCGCGGGLWGWGGVGGWGLGYLAQILPPLFSYPGAVIQIGMFPIATCFVVALVLASVVGLCSVNSPLGRHTLQFVCRVAFCPIESVFHFLKIGIQPLKLTEPFPSDPLCWLNVFLQVNWINLSWIPPPPRVVITKKRGFFAGPPLNLASFSVFPPASPFHFVPPRNEKDSILF